MCLIEKRFNFNVAKLASLGTFAQKDKDGPLPLFNFQPLFWNIDQDGNLFELLNDINKNILWYLRDIVDLPISLFSFSLICLSKD